MGNNAMVKKIIEKGHCFMRKRRRDRSASRQSCRITPLSEKSNCGPTRVCSINGDRKHCARLASLGLYPGNEIELICPAEGSQCIIKVHGGTLSMDLDTTENILVTE